MSLSVIAQYISLAATVFIVLGILGKQKSTIMLWFSLYNVVILATYFMLGRYTGSILVFVTLIKSILFYILARKNIRPQIWILVLFEISYIVIPIFLWESATDIILIANLLLVTYLCWQSNIKLLKFGYILSSILLITYDIIVGAYTAIIAEVVFLISTCISIYQLYHPRANKKTEQVTKEDTNKSTVETPNEQNKSQ